MRAMLILVLAALSMGAAPQDTAPVSVLEIGPMPNYAYRSAEPWACNDAECLTEGRSWCNSNNHAGDGDDPVYRYATLANGDGNCTVTCDDDYMVIITDTGCADATVHVRRVVVLAPDGRVWVEFRPEAQPVRRLMLADPSEPRMIIDDPDPIGIIVDEPAHR